MRVSFLFVVLEDVLALVEMTRASRVMPAVTGAYYAPRRQLEVPTQRLVSRDARSLLTNLWATVRQVEYQLHLAGALARWAPVIGLVREALARVARAG